MNILIKHKILYKLSLNLTLCSVYDSKFSKSTTRIANGDGKAFLRTPRRSFYTSKCFGNMSRKILRPYGPFVVPNQKRKFKYS